MLEWVSAGMMEGTEIRIIRVKIVQVFTIGIKQLSHFYNLVRKELITCF